MKKFRFDHRPVSFSRNLLLSFYVLIFFLPVLNSSSFNLIASEQELKFTNFTIEDGLSHSKVNCVYQDTQGFLWFGTNEGLNQYNGHQFTIFQQDPDNPYSLSANLIRCILEDSRGLFWVGTEAGGLNWYDRDQKRFTHFTSDSTSGIILSGNNVNAVVEDRLGRLWLGTENGLDLLDMHTGQAIHFTLFQPNEDAHISNEIVVLYEDSENVLWLGTTSGGLYAFDRDRKVFTCHMHDENNRYSISDNEIRSIHEDSYGNLWIGTFGGLNLFDRKTKRFQHFYPDRNNPESTTIRSILDDGRGNLWIGNRNGLYHFDRETHRFTHYSHDPNNPYSLIQNSVQVIFQDAKKDLWIGTRGGISYLNALNLPFIHYRADANDRRFLNKQSVFAMLEDSQGDLWFGTENGGLNHLDRKTGFFTYFMHSATDPGSISANNIKALLEDRNGELWIGTYNGGLNLYDKRDRRFIRYVHSNNPYSLSIDNVMALLDDKKGHIWVGTFGGGLDCFDKKSRRFEHLLQEWYREGFYNIHCLIEDREGKLWMGASLSKIGCLDPVTKEFTFIRLDHNINNVDVRCGFEDRKGDLWFGTVGGGLYHLGKKDMTFKVFTQKDGLPSNIVYGILEDAGGNLWISTTNGLCRFDPATGKVKNFFKENGLQSDQFNYNANLMTRDGEMFFGGINGVTAFYPKEIQENSYIPPVVITNFTIFNKPVEAGGKNPVLEKDISHVETLRLSYRHTVFSFEFIALNYAISEQNQYAYKMEGFEQDWNYAGNRRFATYTNLSPGSYTFRVKAANNDGLWNENGASVRITIVPPFWETFWFKLILIALILLIIRHFINYMHQKRNLLKARALANLAQLKLLRNQMNPHFLFNTLGSIRSMILIDKEKAWDMVSELSEFFRYTLVNFNKIETLLDDEVNAVQNYLNIEKVRYRDLLRVSFTIDPDARKCIVPAFICQPLIENSIKYGMHTSPMPLEVKISISFQNDRLSIDVSNTGKLSDEQEKSAEKADIHGTSVENMKKRLEIMFKDKFTFQLFERDGWVHARILIVYDRKNEKRLITLEQEEFAGI